MLPAAAAGCRGATRCTDSGHQCPGPDRERAHPLDHHGCGAEACPRVGSASRPGQVLADGDAGRQQPAVDGTALVGRVVDVERVDAHEGRARATRCVGGRLGQEGVADP